MRLNINRFFFKLLSIRKPDLSTFVISLFFSLFLSTAYANTFDAIVTEARNGGQYVTPKVEDVNTAEKLFILVLQGKALETTSDWEKLGFEALILKDGHVIVKEMDNRKEGRGVYLFKNDAPLAVNVEAPHSFDDLRTDKIALKLANSGKYKAYAWSTVRRRPREGEPQVSSDLAHLDDTYFMAFTTAFAKVHPDSMIVQLHGYDRKKRDSDEGEKSDVIVSGGINSITPKSEKISQCLKDGLKWQVLLFPRDVQELGALTNTQVKALQKLNYNHFVHIEMTKNIRATLIDDPEKLKTYSNCLVP